MQNQQSSQRKPSLLGGAIIVAGTAVGAGMLALPTVSAGMWSLWGMAILLLTWFFMFYAGLIVLEMTLHYPVGASFDTFIKDNLGQGWNIVNGIAVAFVGYILVYAYISGGGSAVVQMFVQLGILEGGDQLDGGAQRIVGILFALVLALIVWWSAKAVDRLATILVGGMIITFFVSISGLTFNINLDYLLNVNATANTKYTPFIFAALPAFLTSFGYHYSVPSLVKYYGKQPKSISKSVLLGTMLALIFYIFWVLAIFGNIPREVFNGIGGNVGDLMGAVGGEINSSLISYLLSIFATFAIASSFLGVALGMFDYLADLLNIDDTKIGRTKTAALLFLPPLILGWFFPEGFLVAIGWAGLAVAIWTAIIPGMAVTVSRKKFPNPSFKAFGGNLLPYILIGYGLLVALCHILSMPEVAWLPVFGK